MSSKSVRQKAAMAPSTAVKAPLGESSLNRALDAPSASAKRTGAEPATPGLTLVGAATVDAAADGTPEEVRESASYLGDASAIRGDSLEKTTPAQTPVQNGQQQQAGILATPLTGASTMSAMTTTGSAGARRSSQTTPLQRQTTAALECTQEGREQTRRAWGRGRGRDIARKRRSTRARLGREKGWKEGSETRAGSERERRWGTTQWKGGERHDGHGHVWYPRRRRGFVVIRPTLYIDAMVFRRFARPKHRGQATTRVYSGIDKTTGERCAVKVVTKKSMTKAKIAEVRREGRVMRELQALPHPNLVRMKDGFEDRRNIYIIMEL